jgi:ribonucleoside-triphosphate reductase
MDKSYDLRDLDGIGEQLDVNEFSKKFFSKKGATTADVSIDSNSNLDSVNIVHYNKEFAKPTQRLNSYYILWKYGRQLFGEEFSFEAIQKQFTKEIYINDFHTFGAGLCYCFNFSCIDIMYLGLPFVKRVTSSSPRHLDTYFNQLMELVAFAANNQSGATSVADALIVASYYVDKLYAENPTIPIEFLNKLVEQNIQSFIYRCNQLYRDSAQTPFTNVSLYDDIFLDKFCNEYVFLESKKPNKDTIKRLQQIYVKTMNSILKISPATFPITTACFSIDDENNIQDESFLDFIAEANKEFGFINIYAGKTSTLSSCCRLKSDNTNEYLNVSFGGGSSKIGSVSVCTLNLPRLAYTSKTKEEFLDKLAKDVEVVCKINQVRRFVIKKRIDNNHAPLYNLGFMDIGRQYSTCGLNGINECLEILGLNILNEDGQQFLLKMLETINNVNNELAKRYKIPTNCEQVPGEQSAFKLAQADKLLGYNKKYHMYSNQFIPLTVKADIYDRIKLQGLFDKHFSGGSILHLNIVDKITHKDFIKKLIKHAVKQGVIYHAINYNIQKCENMHVTIGKNIKCPTCNSNIIENITRIVGYLVPVSNWGLERRKEDYPNREFYQKEELQKEAITK